MNGFKNNYRIPSHFTFLSLQCIATDELLVIHTEDQMGDSTLRRTDHDLQRLNNKSKCISIAYYWSTLSIRPWEFSRWIKSFPLLLFFISLPFHSGRQSSYPFPVKSTTFNIHPDRFSSEFHPPIAGPFPLLILWGVILILPSFYLPSFPSIFFLTTDIFIFPLSSTITCSATFSPLPLFCPASHTHHSSSFLVCKLPSDKNLRWQFNESRPS